MLVSVSPASAVLDPFALFLFARLPIALVFHAVLLPALPAPVSRGQGALVPIVSRGHSALVPIVFPFPRGYGALVPIVFLFARVDPQVAAVLLAAVSGFPLATSSFW